jgi:alkylation response protein AidB-like acyl-CoA dehydrogenase
VQFGTPEQNAKYFPDLAAGMSVAAICMTEPDAGSDLQGIRTNAKSDGDDFIVNGSKIFITNGIVADTFIVVAITDGDAKSKTHGISSLSMKDKMSGLKKGKNLKKVSMCGQDTAEILISARAEEQRAGRRGPRLLPADDGAAAEAHLAGHHVDRRLRVDVRDHVQVRAQP